MGIKTVLSYRNKAIIALDIIEISMGCDSVSIPTIKLTETLDMLEDSDKDYSQIDVQAIAFHEADYGNEIKLRLVGVREPAAQELELKHAMLLHSTLCEDLRVLTVKKFIPDGLSADLTRELILELRALKAAKNAELSACNKAIDKLRDAGYELGYDS